MQQKQCLKINSNSRLQTLHSIWTSWEYVDVKHSQAVRSKKVKLWEWIYGIMIVKNLKFRIWFVKIASHCVWQLIAHLSVSVIFIGTRWISKGEYSYHLCNIWNILTLLLTLGNYFNALSNESNTHLYYWHVGSISISQGTLMTGATTSSYQTHCKDN